MRKLFWIPCILSLALSGGCASGEPSEQVSPARYRHTRAFLFEQVREQIEQDWPGIEREDPETGEVESTWSTNLATMSNQGLRHRLIVRLEGDEGKGYEIKATQITERNTEQVDPLDKESADWKESGSDGALAIRFLRRMDIRLNPPVPGARDRVR